jgi:hemoglobin/transferrin/lactoferrin receptor protein
VAYFRNSFKDYIESQTDIAAGTTQANNVGSARISGYELELRYDVADFYTTLAASRIRGKDKDTGTDLSNIPADKVSLGAGYTFTAYNLDVGGRATLVKGQERTGSAAEELSGYTLVDAFAVWQPGFLNGVTLNAGIDNILDRTYKTSIGTINQPGRNFKLGATVQF